MIMRSRRYAAPFLLGVLVLVGEIGGQNDSGGNYFLSRLRKAFRLDRVYSRVEEAIRHIPDTFAAYRHPEKSQLPIPYWYELPCNTTGFRSRTPPTSVHRLQPGDIDIIAAMGDSLTAANGAFSTEVYTVPLASRGVSFTIGGEGTWREYLTLPNILKEFNPRLIGYALGDGSFSSRKAQFNVAVPGGDNNDLPMMAENLVGRLRNDSRVDMKNHWKLITVFAGHNDLCSRWCTPQYGLTLEASAKQHVEKLREALDILYRNLPRTLVSLLPVGDVTTMGELKNLPRQCDRVHRMLCPCVAGPSHRSSPQKTRALAQEYQRLERQLVESGRYDGREDFTVVMQNFTANIEFPERKGANDLMDVDLRYVSADCFHLSQKGHSGAAFFLWRNLMQPYKYKTLTWRILDDAEDYDEVLSKFICPSREFPYIFTKQNSIEFIKRFNRTGHPEGAGKIIKFANQNTAKRVISFHDQNIQSRDKGQRINDGNQV